MAHDQPLDPKKDKQVRINHYSVAVSPADGTIWASVLGYPGSVIRVVPGAGRHCPEGWTLHPFPGPQLRDVKDPGSAETSYYVWVDWFGVLGLGKNVPIAMGNGSDSILPFVDGKFVVLRLPYPSGLFPKNVDGRIDDEGAGWKGRGLWTTSGSRVNFHLEGGKENRPKAIKLQLRLDPLAR